MQFIEPVARVLERIDTADGAYAKQMALKIGGVEDLCTFPVVAQMVLKILSAEDYKMSNVSAVVNRDPALAAKIMRLANSAFFCRGKQVDSIDKAMVRLGRANVIESVCAVATMDLFPDVDGVGREIRDHCAATAAICQELVNDLLPSHKSGAFLCGLMHDVGKLLLIAAGEPLYATTSNAQRNAADELAKLERGEFGFDHALLAGQILSLWKFPEPIPTVVALHHDPAIAYLDEEVGYVVAMTRIASQIEHQLTYQAVSVDEFTELTATAVDCNYAAVTEDYLIGKWDALCDARTQALSLFT